MKASNLFRNQRWLIALILVAAAVMVPMLAAGMTAWAEDDNPQKAPVTGLSATPGSNPGEIDVSWDAHPAGAKDYRVAWAPDGESFRPAGDTDWNAKPTATGMTITGLTGGDDYKVKVQARFDSNPRSRWSSVETATATEADDPPPPVIQPPEPTPTPDHAEGHSSPHHLSISDASATEGDDIAFTVTLNPVSTDDVTFDLDTSRQSDDNAENDDFTAVHSTFTITAGQTSTTLTVPTRGRRAQYPQQPLRRRRNIHLHHQQPNQRRNSPSGRQGHHHRRRGHTRSILHKLIPQGIRTAHHPEQHHLNTNVSRERELGPTVPGHYRVRRSRRGLRADRPDLDCIRQTK